MHTPSFITRVGSPHGRSCLPSCPHHSVEGTSGNHAQGATSVRAAALHPAGGANHLPPTLTALLLEGQCVSQPWGPWPSPPRTTTQPHTVHCFVEPSRHGGASGAPATWAHSGHAVMPVAQPTGRRFGRLATRPHGPHAPRFTHTWCGAANTRAGSVHQRAPLWGQAHPDRGWAPQWVQRPHVPTLGGVPHVHCTSQHHKNGRTP